MQLMNTLFMQGKEISVSEIISHLLFALFYLNYIDDQSLYATKFLFHGKNCGNIHYIASVRRYVKFTIWMNYICYWNE